MAYQTHVAKILSERALVLAAGWSNGVDKGDEFNIVTLGKEIKDDHTGKSLGTYDRIKEKVEITEVYENFSVAKKLRRMSMLSPLISSGAFGASTVADELPIKKTEISPLTLDEFDHNIHIGDVAVKIGS